jgi:PAS domain S-box-containing protein
MRSAVGLIVRSGFPMFLVWGPQQTFIYNDAYAPILGDKHPQAFGRRFWEVWPEIRGQIEPVIEAAFAGQESFFEDLEVSLVRDGAPARTWFTFSYSPVQDAQGEIPGVLCVCVETTAGVLAREAAKDAQRRQHAMFEQAPGFICILEGRDHLFTFTNHTHRRLFGRDVTGKPVREAFPELEGQGFFELLDQVYATGERYTARAAPALIQPTPGGPPEQRFLDFVYEPIRDAGGQVYGIFCEGFDVTDAVREQTVRDASESRLQFLDALSRATAKLAQADDVLATTTRMLGEHLNLSVCAYADMDEDEDGFTIRGDWSAPGSTSIVGHYFLADFGKLAVENLGAGQPLVVNNNLEQLAPEEAATFQAIGITATICMPLVKDGRLRALMAIHDKAPRLWTQDDLALLNEVTERSWAHVERVGSEAQLRTSNGRFEAAVRAVQGVLWTNDAEGRMLGDQPGWAALTGQTQEVYEGYGWSAAVHPEDAHPTLVAWQAAVAERRPFVFEHRLRRADGTWGTFSIRAVPTFAEDGAILEWVGVHTDVTTQRRTEAELRELNANLERRVSEALAERKLLADLVEGTDAFVQVVDPQFRWLAINRAAAEEFERIFGVRPRAGQSMLDVLADQPEHQEAVRAVWARALGGEEFTETAEFGDPGRARRCYEMKYNVLRDASGKQVGAYQFVYDVTDRILEQERLAMAEEQLRQAQKMEAMGQLTGGVAHDFNNLLTPILGALDMLQRRGVGSEREQRLISGALHSADRAKTLVQRLLAFARRQPLQAAPVDVGELIAGMADLVSSTIGPQIKVLVDVEPDLPPAMADVNQLEMALLNLAVNARDAMAEAGTLRLTATRGEVLRGDSSGFQPGRYLRVSVADTGAGMDEATLARAVEPFFSTKGIGKGTGLGLSMVHGLVQQLGGGLKIRSRPELGTNVELWLPESTHAVASPAPPTHDRPHSTRRGAVLLVDDEDLVRASTADMLGDLGYDVLEARSAEEALSLIDGGLRPSIVITDHLMPGMTGVDLAKALRAQLPDLPVLLVSGYAEHPGLSADLPLLSKPFRNTDLAQSIAALA